MNSETQYFYGSTHTSAALRRMRTRMFTKEHGDRENVQNIAIVLTDGISNVNHEATIKEARSAKRQGKYA